MKNMKNHKIYSLFPKNISVLNQENYKLYFKYDFPSNPQFSYRRLSLDLINR